MVESKIPLTCLNGGESKIPIFKLVESGTPYNSRIKDLP